MNSSGTSPTDQPSDWHSRQAAEILMYLGVSEAIGLSAVVAEQRLHVQGPNRLPSAPRRGPLQRFLTQLHNPLIYILLAAAGITAWLAHYVDSGVILGVVLINALIGFVQEGKAERALEAVQAMLAAAATVIRDGERHEVEASTLVPGDIVLLESGVRVPADIRLLHMKDLAINEATLTGESVPVEKRPDAVSPGAGIGDRRCMAYTGTVVTFGTARGVVVATGSASEIGRIGALVAGVERISTPLIRRLEHFAREITLLIAIISLLTFLYGHLVQNLPALDIFLAVVGLAVAAIPEGLPAIVTITLAVGTGIMARQKAIVRRLPAVETLGSVTIICSDKTGTLTRNEMTVVQVLLPSRNIDVSGAGYTPEGGFHYAGIAIDPAADSELRALAHCALLCNNTQLRHHPGSGWTLAGDPTEGALLTLAIKTGLDHSTEIKLAPRRDEIPFESEHRFMATLHHDHAGQAYILLKGAPERVLALCTQDSHGLPLHQIDWEHRIVRAARHGQRLLALARCAVPPDTVTLTTTDITPRFTLLGMVGMIDPPRPEAIAAITECRTAGIRIMMITGDHAVTAAAIGSQLGLNVETPLTGTIIDTLDDRQLLQHVSTTDVIARASPEHKLRLVNALRSQGEIVAMTGDGVNDAPALKAADIGVAMGRRGTDAAREAAALVLTDDNFATIVGAVREGRRIFDNIKKSLVFILPTNGGEAGVILLAVFAGLALPITAAQILWVNMVTTITLALALAFEPMEAGAMHRPPRPPKEPLLTRRLLIRITYVSLLMVSACYTVFNWELAQGHSIETARTAVVNMLVFGELIYLFNARHFTDTALRRDVVYGNPVAFWASAILLILQLLMTYTPAMQKLFHTTALEAKSWGLILLLSLTLFLAIEGHKWWLRRIGVRHL